MIQEESVKEEINRSFEDGSVFESSDETLDQFLCSLSSGHVPNDMVRHRQIIRGLTINTIKTSRLIASINRANRRYTLTIITLSAVAIIVSGFSIWQSLSTTRQMEEMLSIQEKQLQEMRE